MFAVKTIEKKNLAPWLMDTRNHNQLFELTVLKSVSHPNLVSFICSSETWTEYKITTEYINGSDLWTFIQKSAFNEEEAAFYLFNQVVQGIAYLHGCGFAHMDVKPENIIIGDQGVVKLVEFGLAAHINEYTSPRGTYEYMPPEGRKNLYVNPAPCDYWALGCTFFCIRMGANIPDIYKRVLEKADVDVSKLSGGTKKVLGGLINENPNERTHIQVLQNDPFLKQARFGSYEREYMRIKAIEPPRPTSELRSSTTSSLH